MTLNVCSKKSDQSRLRQPLQFSLHNPRSARTIVQATPAMFTLDPLSGRPAMVVKDQRVHRRAPGFRRTRLRQASWHESPQVAGVPGQQARQRCLSAGRALRRPRPQPGWRRERPRDDARGPPCGAAKAVRRRVAARGPHVCGVWTCVAVDKERRPISGSNERGVCGFWSRARSWRPRTTGGFRSRSPRSTLSALRSRWQDCFVVCRCRFGRVSAAMVVAYWG